MFEDLKKTVDEFRNAKSVAIFSPSIDTVDKAVSIIVLAKICSKQEKNFQILCPKTLKVPISKMFEKEGLEISTLPTSKDYVVSVDYSIGNIDKVICKRDEDNKRLNFVITPKGKEFNFDNVELISGGMSFDLVFSFGVNNVDKLDDKFKTIYENTDVISITKKETDIGKYNFLINGQKSYSEIIFDIIKAFSSDFSEELMNILLQGIISKYKLLENGDSEGWLIANKLVKYGADLNKALQNLYYSKDHDNFELQRKVFENIRVDKKNRVVWSKVAIMMNVDSSNLDTKGRILFNICEDFDIAFVIYHLDKENIKVVFESNDPEKFPALKLAKAFSGSGSNSRIVFTNGDILAEDFEAKFFDAVDSIYGIRVV